MSTIYMERGPTFTDERMENIVHYFKSILQEIPVNCWIAGGSIVSAYVNQSINDIDLYFNKKKDYKEAKEFFIKIGAEEACEGDFSFKVNVKDTKYNNLNGLTFDLVSRIRKTPQTTIKQFDIIACCISIDKEGVLYYLDRCMDDLKSRTIHFNSEVKVIGDEERILQRLNKYGRKGFELSLSEASNFVKLLDKARPNRGKLKNNFY